MVIQARYVHTNLIASDWRALAGFYQRVFGCVPVPPERDFRGAGLEAATTLPGAHSQGMHLRLPGYGAGGPTLEVFQYEPAGQRQGASVANRPGFTHLAFLVEDVKEALARFRLKAAVRLVRWLPCRPRMAVP